MATAQFTLDTQHQDMIHDAQFDYYGRRLATSSSDRTIRIFDVSVPEQQTLLAELKGHEGPVWEVSWSHPKFGSLLASCSYDRKVIIWRETSKNEWSAVYTFDAHELSVNSVAWAPYEYGAMLACGSSDGFVHIIQLKETGQWEVAAKFHAHQIGLNAVSWAPPTYLNSSILSAPTNAAGAQPPMLKRLATAGSDNLIKIWRYVDNENRWKGEDARDVLEGHADWVRDVAWAPSLGLSSSTMASCSQDGVVLIWTQEDPSAPWHKRQLTQKFSEPVWRVSWSVTGNILAVSGGDNKVTLWKEGSDGEWACISTLDEHGNAIAAH